METVNTAAGTGRIDVRDQSSETEVVEKSTRATVTQIYSHSMDGSNMYSMDVNDKVSMRSKSVQGNHDQEHLQFVRFQNFLSIL